MESVTTSVELVHQYGTSAVLVATLFFSFWMVKKMFAQEEKRQDEQNKTNTRFIETLTQMDIKSSEFMGHVRREHESMMKNMERVCNQNDEITKCLGRINGYKNSH